MIAAFVAEQNVSLSVELKQNFFGLKPFQTGAEHCSDG